ncbi:(Fe-S)-binding protein [Candidatus Magnetomoraceae bacterium gMMP-15]
MTESTIKLGKEKKSIFKDKVMGMLPDGGNLNLCLTCGACSSGCPATGLEDMDPRKFLRMAALGMDDEITTTNWVWMCTQCQRCKHVCPMDINIAGLVYEVRASWPREKRPSGILGSCDMALRNDSCSAMGASPEDFQFVVEDVSEEVREGHPGFENLQAPIDKEGAHFFLNQNSREPVTEPDELIPLWKILHIVGADWTYGSKGWGGENYCMFLADDDAWKHVLTTSVNQAKKLGCKVFLNTECGHLTYSVRAGIKKFNIEHEFEVASIYKYYAKWIREGKLKVNSDWNKDLKIKFTAQDPCQIVRKNFGDVAADDLRYVVKAVVGEENFIDMIPNKSNNFCCGGGGGFLQSGYKDARLAYGKLKDDQIQATGADYCVAACHNCHAQIHELSEHYGGGYQVVHLWTLIGLSLGILGPNEREYLGDDLKEVNVLDVKEQEW